MKIQFEVCSDVYLVGHTEDGEEYIGERYFVRAEDEDGFRWRYHIQWNGSEVQYDHESGMTYFPDIRARAEALAGAVARSAALRPFDAMSYEWSEDRPGYGSDAWICGNQDSIEIAWERAMG